MEKKLKYLGTLARFEMSNYLTKEPLKGHSFIYPSVAGGKIIPIFKILLSNYCKFNCLYCANRKDRDCPRYRLTPDFLAETFFNFWKKNYVAGLFLSSSIDGDVNEVQEKIIETAKILRKKFNYPGYIHLKILPGADPYLIRKASIYADRLSLNMETVSTSLLKKISKEKDFSKSLLKTLKNLSIINQERELKSGVTTQFIVGSGNEKDKDILGFSFYLYRNLQLRKIYYSGFSPVPATPLENKTPCEFKRILRLYQADILIRKYGFRADEIIFDEEGNLDKDKDPKEKWAEKNPSFFPVEITKDDFEILIRVPGIGFQTAKKIIKIRKETKITPEILKKIGVGKKSFQYITISGKNIVEKVNEEDEFKNTLFENI